MEVDDTFPSITAEAMRSATDNFYTGIVTM